MKRHGYLKRLWCTYESLLRAWKEVKKNKSYHFSVLSYEHNLAVNLSNLLRVLEDGTYRPRELRSFYIHDPKTRLIEAPHIEDRIVQHAILEVVRPLIECRFVDQTFACRKHKGTHASNDLLKKYLVGYKNSGYFLKIDIEKFFYSIDHSVLERQVREVIKCPETLKIIRLFYDNKEGKGLPLGNVTSQVLANLALNPIDHFIKRDLKIRHYVRYMDDLILLSDNKDVLKYTMPLIIAELEDLKLKVNKKTKISRISEGIDFVGYRTWYNRRLIRKRSLFKIKRKLIKNANQERIASFLSHAKNTDSLIYVIRQILKVVPEKREWIVKWYLKHKSK